MLLLKVHLLICISNDKLVRKRIEFVEDFDFILQIYSELSTMYRTMESKNYHTPEEAIADLRTGKLHAFIWDSPRLEYEAGLNCDLVTVGESFGRSSYGIALRKKDSWINPLSHAILSFHERGFMEMLDNQWIFSKQYVENIFLLVNNKVRFCFLFQFEVKMVVQILHHHRQHLVFTICWVKFLKKYKLVWF